ncbi:hypothetical protein ONE63_002730 [Megalurothrips usitatus]|uniref:Uncharacterized protein n=1 Tax=Megalurothrips usitatus TaxID=439358 RepID=A0AAV7X9A8_9NEOP|nr:hypothetical protein ONE63_002730 [Megalurothrips usitatus]
MGPALAGAAPAGSRQGRALVDAGQIPDADVLLWRRQRARRHPPHPDPPAQSEPAARAAQDHRPLGRRDQAMMAAPRGVPVLVLAAILGVATASPLYNNDTRLTPLTRDL